MQKSRNYDLLHTMIKCMQNVTSVLSHYVSIPLSQSLNINSLNLFKTTIVNSILILTNYRKVTITILYYTRISYRTKHLTTDYSIQAYSRRLVQLLTHRAHPYIV